MTKKWLLFLSQIILVASLVPATLLCQGGGCPGLHPDYLGWPKNTTVKYRVDGLTVTNNPNATDRARAAARAGMIALDAFSQTTNSGIRFVEAGPNEAAAVVFRTATARIPNPYGSGDVAGSTPMSYVSGSDHHVKSAIINLDLDNKGSPRQAACSTTNPATGQPYPTAGPCVFYDPSFDNYDDNLKNIVEHEGLHTMGLADVPMANMVKQASMMSGAYSPNDCVKYTTFGNGSPDPNPTCQKLMPQNGPTECDRTAVNSRYATEPPSGGGEPPPLPPAPPPPPPNCVDLDGDGHYAWPCGDDCWDTSDRIHPGQSHEEKCENYLFFGGQVEDLDCDGWGDYDECASTAAWCANCIVPSPDAPMPYDAPGGGGLDGASVSLQASNNQYVVAEGGGWGDVNANRDYPGSWETFILNDDNGGTLLDGEWVRFRTDAGSYLQALNGGGGPMTAWGPGPGAWETFAIINLTDPGGPILSGQEVALLSIEGGYFACAEGGGGDVVNVNRTGIGAWERFRFIVH